MTFLQTINILILALTANFVFKKDLLESNSDSDKLTIIKSANTFKYKYFGANYPITRDTLNKFPDSLVIEGKLVDYTLGISCGVFCGCGTLKIKLKKQNDNYKQVFIYIGVPCLNVLPKRLNKKTKWELYKLPITDNRCFWTEVPANKFNTKGLPFYTLTKSEITH